MCWSLMVPVMTTRQLLDSSDRSRMIEINVQRTISSLLFTQGGKQILSSDARGMLQRWRADDGHEADEPIQTGTTIFPVALSPDCRWLVCGLCRLDARKTNVRVWDAQTHWPWHEKDLDIKGHTGLITSISISPDSTKLATGGHDELVFIWSMATGERLVGPLQHEGWVRNLAFSPTGDRIATATVCEVSTRSQIGIYDSNNGQRLLVIPFLFYPNMWSPLAWSADGRQLFATSGNEVKRFDTSLGSLLSKWSVPGSGQTASIVLSRNQKFAVAVKWQSLSFWDTSTEKQIGTVITYKSDISSIMLSPDDNCIAAGDGRGKIILQSLRDSIPSPYLIVNVSD